MPCGSSQKNKVQKKLMLFLYLFHALEDGHSGDLGGAATKNVGSLMEEVVRVGLLKRAGAEGVEWRQANPLRCQTDLNLNLVPQLETLGRSLMNFPASLYSWG